MDHFGQVLSTIFDLKKSEFHQKAQHFYSFKSSILSNLANIESDYEKVKFLITEFRSPKAPKWNAQSKGSFGNIDLKFVDQALTSSKYSQYPLSKELEKLINALDLETQKYQYANLFYNLFESETTVSPENDQEKGLPENKKSPEPRKEMIDQFQQFKSLIFDKEADKHIDESVITNYLKSLFKDTPKQLKHMRQLMSACSTKLLKDKVITNSIVEEAISSYIASGGVSSENIKILRDFCKNKRILAEIADVLKMKLASLSSFSWDPKGIETTIVRQLNGKYRVWIQPDLLNGIFFSYLGKYWCSQFYDAAKSIFYKNSYDGRAAWKSHDPQDDLLQQQTRQCYYGEQKTKKSINQERIKRQENYFLTQLAGVKIGKPNPYDDDANDTYDSEDDEKTFTNQSATSKIDPIKLKEEILTILIVETELSKALCRGQSVIRTDYFWFGPSLSHKTIIAVLKFFGMPEIWLDFFQTFLKAPMRIPTIVTDENGDEALDEKNTEILTRERGVPISFDLSSFFGEAVLFCLDFTVNKATEGRMLYRMFDDIWFWDSDLKIAETAWTAMLEFNKIMGLEFNQEKTGSISIMPENSRLFAEEYVEDSDDDKDSKPAQEEFKVNKVSSQILPSGTIGWGLLILDSTGRFVIDQTKIDQHIEEMKFQLSKISSILSWVRAYNSYVSRFLVNNFGKPSHTLGVQHVENIIKTFKRINKEIIPAEFNGDVVKYLDHQIHKQFPSQSDSSGYGKLFETPQNIPTGWFYLTNNHGGLELVNPIFMYSSIMTAHQMDRKNLKERGQPPIKPFFEPAIEETFEQYYKKKNNWLKGKWNSTVAPSNDILYKVNPDRSTFPSFQEYIDNGKAPEKYFNWWLQKYIWLCSQPELKTFFFSIDSKEGHISTVSFQRPGDTDNALGLAHANIVASYYYEEMVDKWGSVNPIWEECMPLGLLDLWKKQRIVWK